MKKIQVTENLEQFASVGELKKHLEKYPDDAQVSYADDIIVQYTRAETHNEKLARLAKVRFLKKQRIQRLRQKADKIAKELKRLSPR